MMGKKRKKKQVERDEEVATKGDCANSEEAVAEKLSEEAEEDPLARLEAEKLDLEDKLKRAFADMQNMRRRQLEDHKRAIQSTTARFVSELLPVLDSLQFAEQGTGTEEDLRQGLTMLHQMLRELLSRNGVEPIVAQGERFDPMFHEALAVQPRDDVEAGFVVQVHQEGLRMGDKVLRPSRVVVSQAMPDSQDSEDSPDAQTEESQQGPAPEDEGTASTETNDREGEDCEARD